MTKLLSFAIDDEVIGWAARQNILNLGKKLIGVSNLHNSKINVNFRIKNKH
jgi:hypothetical protein